MVLDFAFLYQGPEEDSIKGGVFVGNTLMCSCQVDTHVNLYTSWDTQLWDKGVRSEGGRSLSTETVPGWRLKRADGVAPDGEAEKPSLFPNLPFIWGESSQTSLEAGRQPSEPQLVVLKFRLQTCPSHRRHSLLRLPAVLTVFHWEVGAERDSGMETDRLITDTVNSWLRSGPNLVFLRTHGLVLVLCFTPPHTFFFGNKSVLVCWMNELWKNLEKFQNEGRVYSCHPVER